MFTFSFNIDESQPDSNVNKAPKPELQWKSSEEIKIEECNNYDSIINACQTNKIVAAGLEIEYLSSSDVVTFLKSQNNDLAVLSADESHSDLVTAEYEGGLKIWECTYDLLDLIKQRDFNFVDKQVLDLGCGSGIVGMVAFLKGADCCFQDYNEEVLKFITIPNVVVNSRKKNQHIKKCRFYSGDWSSFVDVLDKNSNKFDYIFTSETIYNTDNYNKLIRVFKNLLKPTGKVYLAAKSYYFGVGGGITSFQEALDADNLDYASCWKCTEGVTRDILEINLK